MLAVKIAGAVGVNVDDAAELHVSAFLQSHDARHIAAARTGAATRASGSAVWNEELLLQMSTETSSSVSSVLLELRTGDAGGPAGTGGVLGFATLEWKDVATHATSHGWAIEPPLLSASGAPLGARLLVRLLFTDAAAAANNLRELKSALADAMSTTSKERSALTAASETHKLQLAQARTQLGLKLRLVTQRATDSEVTAFRSALDGRLIGARRGRDDALKNFHELHQEALGNAMPTVMDRFARSAQGQKVSIESAQGKARTKAAEVSEAVHQQWAITLPAERDRTIDKLTKKTERAIHRVHAAFKRTSEHEGATLGRRLHKIARDAEEKASRECMNLHRESDGFAAMQASGRAEIDAEARETVSNVRIELSRLSSEWQSAVMAHFAASREGLGRTLLEQQAAHREQRAARRVVDASADQSRKAALIKREGLLAEKTTATQKEVDALHVHLAKRLEAAMAAASAREVGSLGRPVDTSPRRIAFGAELIDVKSRSDQQRMAMSQLYSRLFSSRSKASASALVAEVMRACEERGEEIMADTSQLSATAPMDLKQELDDLASEIAKKHLASLAQTHAEGEAAERALIAPAVRELPKHKQLLAQLKYELQQSLQLALSRPAEWFEILNRALRLDENSVMEREERVAASTHTHAAELSAHSMRAAEEVQTEEELQQRRERHLTQEAQLSAEKIAFERRGLLADRGEVPDLKAQVQAAVRARTAAGEQLLLEAKRAAAERHDVPSHKPDKGTGPGGGKGGVEAAEERGGSLDQRFKTRGANTGLANVVSAYESGLLGVMRDHYHHLIAEATASKTTAVAVAAASGNRTTLDWAEEAAQGQHGLSHAENDALRTIEAQMQMELKSAVLQEHGEFAAAVRELAAQREAVREAASRPPQPAVHVDLVTNVRSDPEVAAAEAGVNALRAELTEKAENSIKVDNKLKEQIEASRAEFAEGFEEQRKTALGLASEQLSAREEAAEEGVKLRGDELKARQDVAARKSLALEEAWSDALIELNKNGHKKLEPVRKRLASAKRNLASELISCLRDESDARTESYVRYSLAANEARELAREAMITSLLSTHEADEGKLAELRTSQLEHAHCLGEWEGGFLESLMEAGTLKEEDRPDYRQGLRRPSLDTALKAGIDHEVRQPYGSPSAGSQQASASPERSVSPSENLRTAVQAAKNHKVRIAFKPPRGHSLAGEAKQAWADRLSAGPQSEVRLAPKVVRGVGPMQPPPLQQVHVGMVLADVESRLGQSVPWAAPRRSMAQAMHASLMRDEKPTMPSAAEQEEARQAEEAAAAAAAAAVANSRELADAEAKAARKKQELERTTMMHVAQRRSLETQAEEEVANARLPEEAEKRLQAKLAREAAVVADEEHLRMAKEESQEAKEALSAAVAEKAMAAGSGHMRTGRLWQEALLRRQAEEQMVHGRRLRQEAHAAASGKLGEKGEALKEELQSLKTLMASVINAQGGHAPAMA